MKKTWMGACKAALIESEGRVRYGYANCGYAGTSARRKRLVEMTGTVELTIDISALVECLGEKALRSKSGRSSALRGKVKAVIRTCKDVKGEWTDVALPKGAIIKEEIEP